MALKSYLLVLFVLSLVGMADDLVHLRVTDCQFAYNGIDLQSKQMRRELIPETLFRFTPPELKNDLMDQNLLEVDAQLAQIDKEYFLNLNLKLNSARAKQQYGHISNGYILRIRLISGDLVELRAGNSADGHVDGNKNLGIYAVQYALGRGQLNQLSRKDVDKISLQWSSGLEEYTVYQTDFFIRQIKCLNQARQN